MTPKRAQEAPGRSAELTVKTGRSDPTRGQSARFLYASAGAIHVGWSDGAYEMFRRDTGQSVDLVLPGQHTRRAKRHPGRRLLLEEQGPETLGPREVGR